MNGRFHAVYRAGAFVPDDPCLLPENSRVELQIQGPVILVPTVTDAEERTRLMQRLTQRMQQNRLPAAASSLTRETLHDRR